MGSQKKHSVGRIVSGTFANIGRVIISLIMVGIITGCIIASVMTVYVLRYINSDEQIRLEDVTLKYTTILYAEDPQTGEPYELQRLQTRENRIWVSYDQIPQHVKDAVVAIEDKRFWEHNGVDWKRTFGAFVNMFIPIYDSQHGGSTITQQLIKNITGDDEVRIERKVQEIFRALNLSKRYSREQILEAYLNTVYYSNNSYGVQAAANTYFGKDVSELSIAEGAAIVGITKAPGAYDPFVYPENNKKRQEDILYEMHEQGMITDEEYQEALAEELHFQKDAAYERISPVYSYFVDHVIEEVIDDLMEEKGYTYEFAQQMITSGGYRIYTTVDENVQNFLTDFYSDVSNFPTVTNAEYPQSACVITDVNGKILGLAGGIGEKQGMREFDRATQAYRQSGSSIKPLAAYLQAFENNIVTWSTMIEDSPIVIKDENGNDIKWPNNFQGNYIGPITIDRAIQESRNTIPVKLVQAVGESTVFNFLKQKLGFDSLIDRKVIDGRVVGDINLSSMALGGMTNGVTVLEMAGGYQIYGNGGYFTKPYAYTKVLDSDGNVVLERDTTPRRVISAETATIVNKLLQRVTTGPYGTGTPARFSNMPVAGKTGTSTDDKDQWFIGVTPYYVCAVWMGYDTPETIYYRGVPYPPPILWKSIMGPLHQNLEVKQFDTWGNVVEKTYCTETGDLALDTCPSTAVGWYKADYLPNTCTEHSGVVDSIDLDEADYDRESSRSSRRIHLSTDDDDTPRIIDNED